MFKKVFTAVIVIAALAALAGMAKATQDTIAHHYSGSIFAQPPFPKAFFGPESWKNKYNDWDQGDKRPRFPGSTTIFVSVTDAWHLADNLRTLLLIAAFVYAALTIGDTAAVIARIRYDLLWFLIAFTILVSFQAAFHICYTYIYV